MLKRTDKRALAALGLMPLSFIGVLLVFWLFGGTEALPWRQLDSRWQGAFVWPWVAWSKTALAMIGALPAGGMTVFVLAANWLVTSLFYALLIRSIRRDAVPYVVFAWCAHLMTSTRIVYGSALQSMPRYVLVLFPAFVVLAVIGERRAWFNRVYVYLCALLWLVCGALFVAWRWVA